MTNPQKRNKGECDCHCHTDYPGVGICGCCKDNHPHPSNMFKPSPPKVVEIPQKRNETIRAKTYEDFCKHQWVIYSGWQNIEGNEYLGAWGVDEVICCNCGKIKKI